MLSHNGCIDKVSPQYEYTYGYQDHPSKKNLFSHWWHWIGFSLVWIIIWWSRKLLNSVQCALKWFFPTMSQHMSSKNTLLWKCSLTMGALIRSLPSMTPHMFIKTTILWKCFVTLGALKWLLLIMYHHMFINTTLLWKFFLIKDALIWFLPSMNHHMLVKNTLQWKCFYTLCIEMVSPHYESAYE